jgi:hypothetical protein
LKRVESSLPPGVLESPLMKRCVQWWDGADASGPVSLSFFDDTNKPLWRQQVNYGAHANGVNDFVKNIRTAAAALERECGGAIRGSRRWGF